MRSENLLPVSTFRTLINTSFQAPSGARTRAAWQWHHANTHNVSSALPDTPVPYIDHIVFASTGEPFPYPLHFKSKTSPTGVSAVGNTHQYRLGKTSIEFDVNNEDHRVKNLYLQHRLHFLESRGGEQAEPLRTGRSKM
ncbi:uncharacterized protein BT62DRAFT_1000874 [Guyanagaster necrorhizus]|uniref:Uncharacterized protein n=1 Tax=Guyanagaster necrorhizus TaxID=856835 RepID=A0A9P7W2S2_9AGAR|nr:uncharacterized protein BT62DRAFT_1000874 [Guyanagaster necrorhizus MCA 3950]KAG7451618.1 hypothetical protein BT62DRAFT_1000874 [Guyanagaster necrorhizus MCA 3950]